MTVKIDCIEKCGNSRFRSVARSQSFLTVKLPLPFNRNAWRHGSRSGETRALMARIRELSRMIDDLEA